MHHLLETRLMPGQERAFGQLPEQRRQPDSPNGYGCHQIKPVHAEMTGKEGWHHQPEDVHQMRAEDRNYKSEDLHSALDLTRQEQEKRHSKVQYNEQHPHPVPPSMRTVQILTFSSGRSPAQMISSCAKAL